MKALLEASTPVVKVVDDHDLVEFYFGEASAGGYKTIPASTVEDMVEAERELLELNGLDRNIPAENFLSALAKKKHGLHSLRSIFIESMHADIDIDPDVAADLIKASAKVLSTLNTFVGLGFITYNPDLKMVFARKTPAQHKGKDWMLIGLNKEFFI